MKINLTLKTILEKQAAFTLTENVFVSFIEELLLLTFYCVIQILINVAKINIA